MVQTTNDPRIVFFAPRLRAILPSSSAPTNATSWTSRIAWMSVSSSRPSSLLPYVAEKEIAVWIPSLKHRYASRNHRVCG